MEAERASLGQIIWTFMGERNLFEKTFRCFFLQLAVKEVPIPSSQLTVSFHFHVTPIYPLITVWNVRLFSHDLKL